MYVNPISLIFLLYFVIFYSQNPWITVIYFLTLITIPYNTVSSLSLTPVRRGCAIPHNFLKKSTSEIGLTKVKQFSIPLIERGTRWSPVMAILNIRTIKEIQSDAYSLSSVSCRFLKSIFVCRITQFVVAIAVFFWRNWELPLQLPLELYLIRFAPAGIDESWSDQRLQILMFYNFLYITKQLMRCFTH